MSTSSGPSQPFPKPPLADWERQDKLNIELIGYGWDDKRVTVRFHLPRDHDKESVNRDSHSVGMDVKHSKNWLCEFCGAPARETHVQTFSWTHLDPPRIKIYIHYVCDGDQQHVKDSMRHIHDMFNLYSQGSLGPPPNYHVPRQPGEVYPLAGTCANCEREDTRRKSDLKKCSKCKLTRYCSVSCQKEDWARHKVTCGTIHSINFENWD